VGLGVLVGARGRLLDHRHEGGSIQLVRAGGLVERIVRLTGLDRLFRLHPGLAEALGGDAGLGVDRSGHDDDRSPPEPA